MRSLITDMDTSKEYVSMCEMADLDWDGEIGVCCSIDGETIVTIIDAEWHQDMTCGSWDGKLSVTGHKEIVFADGVIPIYRQDQLQEMMKDKHYSPGRTTHHFLTSFIVWYQYKTSFHPDSMEQLWLSFLMKELYKKTWNGKDWMK